MEAALGRDEYAVEINQTPAFWEVTRRAHQDAVVLRLGRLYDPHATATSLGNLLQTMKENIAGAGASFPAAIASLSASDLDADMASVSSQDPVVEKLLLWRNEYLAHRGTRHVTKGTFTLLPPLQKDELSGLLLKAITLMGKYRELLGYPFLAWGHHEADEFKKLLLLLRAGREARKS